MNNTLRRRRRREQKNFKTAVLVIVAAIVLLYIINVAMGVNNVKGDLDVTNKGYIAITVKSNDTLWTIAEEHMNDNYYDHESFISEVVQINDMNNTQIYAGEQIMIPVILNNNM